MKKIIKLLTLFVLASFLSFSSSKSIRLEDDFYTYVNKEWQSKHPIPKGETDIDNFSIIVDKTEEQLKKLVAELVKNEKKLKEGSDEQKLVTFYDMAKDFKTRNKLRIKPIQNELKAIGSVKTMKEFIELNKEQILTGNSMIYSISVYKDTKDNTQNVLYIDTPGTGLSKLYIEGTNAYAKKRQKAYKNNLINIFMYKGDSKKEAIRKADLVFNLETKIAKFMRTQEEDQDVEKSYNILSIEDINNITNKLGYKEILDKYDLSKAKKIIVSDPNFLEKFTELLTDENLEAFKAKQEYMLIKSNAMYLDKKLIEISAKYSQEVLGVYNIENNSTLAYYVTSSIFSDALGKAYVDKYFDPKTKQEVINMMEDIKETYRRRIRELDWIKEETKNKAIEKINKLSLHVGYPDKWENLNGIEIKSYKQGGNLVSNKNKIVEHEIIKNFKELGEKPDRNKWGSPTYEVNAYYDMEANAIVVPAGIIQSPLYDPQGTPEQKLGGLGAILGHELSHGFDRTGALFDSNGNLNPWWNEEDYKQFQIKVKKVAELFSKIEVKPGHFVNGEISTGEIMADIGGVTVVLDIAKQKGYDLDKVFKAYAKVWRGNILDEALIDNLTDNHPPAKYRVNNIVNLMDDFYKTYNIKETDKMYVKPEDRIKVW